jgi:hypothetical protein
VHFTRTHFSNAGFQPAGFAFAYVAAALLFRRAPLFFLLPFGGSPRIYAGEERFSAPENAYASVFGFSRGPYAQKIPGLKPTFFRIVFPLG